MSHPPSSLHFIDLLLLVSMNVTYTHTWNSEFQVSCPFYAVPMVPKICPRPIKFYTIFLRWEASSPPFYNKMENSPSSAVSDYLKFVGSIFLCHFALSIIGSHFEQKSTSQDGERETDKNVLIPSQCYSSSILILCPLCRIWSSQIGADEKIYLLGYSAN
jgi:hypothetical protein